MSYLYYFCIIYSLVLVTNNTTDFLNVFILCALLSETVGRALSYIDFNFSRRRIFSHVWYHSTSKNSHSLSQIYFVLLISFLIDIMHLSSCNFIEERGGSGRLKDFVLFPDPSFNEISFKYSIFRHVNLLTVTCFHFETDPMLPNAKTRTNRPRKVRELILDSISWSQGVKG